MYTHRDLLKGINNPRLAGREINKIFHTRFGKRNHPPSSIEVLDEDWDNLIILDACRYDLFKQHHTFAGGQLEHRISKGGATPVFHKGNFGGKTIDDTVYVNANPMFADGSRYNCQFYKSINLWESDWSEEHETVLPEVVTKRAIEAADQYPHKRLIVHYNQPHQPFIPSDKDYSYHRPGKHGDDRENHISFWRKMMTGDMDLSKETIWQDYVANFEYVMDAVKELIRNLDGKTVITSDHGNMIGERGYPIPVREWGHWGTLFYDELVKVPWYVIEGDDRPDITSRTPDTGKEVDEEEVKDKLKQLGYAGTEREEST